MHDLNRFRQILYAWSCNKLFQQNWSIFYRSSHRKVSIPDSNRRCLSHLEGVWSQSSHSLQNWAPEGTVCNRMTRPVAKSATETGSSQTHNFCDQNLFSFDDLQQNRLENACHMGAHVGFWDGQSHLGPFPCRPHAVVSRPAFCQVPSGCKENKSATKEWTINGPLTWHPWHESYHWTHHLLTTCLYSSLSTASVTFKLIASKQRGIGAAKRHMSHWVLCMRLKWWISMYVRKVMEGAWRRNIIPCQANILQKM